jgi:hypothetical protein
VGVPAREKLECVGGGGVAVEGAVHEQRLVGVAGQVEGLVVDLEGARDGMTEPFVAPGAVEHLVMGPRAYSGLLRVSSPTSSVVRASSG